MQVFQVEGTDFSDVIRLAISVGGDSDTIAAMAPKRVVYVSCDPGTLGRDVKRFAEHGYGLTQAAAVDLFPRTAHVETVVLLSRQTVE